MADMYIYIAAIATFLCVLYLLLTYLVNKHTYAFSQCQKEVGQDGQLQDRWTFNSGHDHSLIGRTLGRLYISRAAAKFWRDEHKRKASKLTEKKMSIEPNGNIISNQFQAVYMRLRSDVFIFLTQLALIGFGMIVSIIHWVLENNLI